MGRPPAVVVVARHGPRLDAADALWHLTSPTPYDPPLTYGGWTQARALGARIAALLQARDSDGADARGEERDGRPGAADEKRAHGARKRKHRVIIHSSPFLRCVETSIAISAGMSQYYGQDTTPSRPASRSRPPISSSPLVKATNAGGTLTPADISNKHMEPGGKAGPQSAAKEESASKVCLRLDAFLGEWLSPDYYEFITPPPSSLLMVASAKADLLRRGTLLDTSQDVSGSNPASQGHFPGGWGSSFSSVNGASAVDDGAFSTMSSMAQALNNHRDRSSSYGSVGASPFRRGTQMFGPQSGSGYVAPLPNYAISPSDPIPLGYVAHARDACITVDYQWDSMRAPQDWGDGGEYGEEWSAMHKRFRKGIRRMIEWYHVHDECGNSPGPKEEHDDIDRVLILVSHGAGCNALIGALTNQPVLLDVGMASLTMAVRKDVRSTTPTPPYAADNALSAIYDIKLLASTEHLRASSSASSTLNSPQLQPRTKPSPRVQPNRSRFESPSSAASDGSMDGGFKLPAPAARFNVRSNTLVPRASAGLWSKAIPELLDDTDDGKSPAANGARANRAADHRTSGEASGEVQAGQEKNTFHGSNNQRGLWGAPGSVAAGDRVSTPKRRWTVTEH